MTRRALAWFAGGALALLCQNPARAAPAQFYRIVMPRDYQTPHAVSPDGSLVLTTEHVWTPATGLVPVVPSGGIYSRDVSNNGVVVGLTDGDYNAFRTTVGGPLERLGSGDAFGVTPDGSVVVGTAPGGEAFRWTAGGGRVGLGRLTTEPDFSDVATAVSADGSVVAGEADSPQGAQAFRWTAATGMAGLGDLPGGDFHSAALAVSGDGRVIVGYGTGASGTEAFRWTPEAGMVGLGDLPGGTFLSRAFAASADGSVVVGSAAPGAGDGAFIWTADDGMRSLRDVLVTEHGLAEALEGFTLNTAIDISDDGRVIVGYGYNAARETEGFVVIVPEPAAALFLLPALRLLARRRSRQGGHDS